MAIAPPVNSAPFCFKNPTTASKGSLNGRTFDGITHGEGRGRVSLAVNVRKQREIGCPFVAIECLLCRVLLYVPILRTVTIRNRIFG